MIYNKLKNNLKKNKKNNKDYYQNNNKNLPQKKLKIIFKNIKYKLKELVSLWKLIINFLIKTKDKNKTMTILLKQNKMNNNYNLFRMVNKKQK